MEKCDFHKVNGGEYHWCNKVLFKDESEFIIDKTSELDRLKSENARLREALQKISAPDSSHFDGASAFSYKLIAREALNDLRKGGE